MLASFLCIGNRLNGAMVAISKTFVSMSTTQYSELQTCSDVPVTGEGQHGTRYIVTCASPMNGRYVLVYHTEDRFLTLCEVQVIQASKLLLIKGIPKA